MDTDDPWFWSVDRVVKELCTEERTWQLRPPRVLPPPAVLEPILRSEEVDGCTLLALSKDELKSDLGIKVLKHRHTLEFAIKKLRLRSKAWKEENDEVDDESTLGHKRDHLGNVVEREREIVEPDGMADKSTSTPAVNGTISQQSDTTGVADPASTDTETLVAAFDDQPELDESPAKKQRLDDPETLVSPGLTTTEDAANKSGATAPQLETTIAEGTAGPTSDSDALTNPSAQVGEVQKAPLDTTTIAAKKPKRIQPTFITAELSDRDRTIPTDADNVRLSLNVGKVVVGDDGKKRLAMTLTTSAPRPLPAKQAASRPAKEQYAGRKKLLVDDIFYDNVNPQEEVDCRDLADADLSFQQLPNVIPTGKRLYVSKRLRHRFRSKARLFKRRGKLCYALSPYPERLLPRFHIPTFTVFQPNGDHTVMATREERARWPEANPNMPDSVPTSFDEEYKSSFVLPGLDSENHDPFDYDALEARWKDAGGDDPVLPVYGESESEGEYDIHTWEEIENENGILKQPVADGKRRRTPLTNDEVLQAIEEGDRILVEKWRQTKLPKKKVAAYKIWMKAHKDRNRREKISKHQQLIDRLNNERLKKLRQAILDEIWTSKKQVIHQTQLMEQSIFDREEALWEVGLLQQKTVPPRPATAVEPAKLPKPAPDNAQEENDEEEDLDSESDEELSDFVVADDAESISKECEETDYDESAASDPESEFAPADASTSPRLGAITRTSPTSESLRPVLDHDMPVQGLGNDEASSDEELHVRRPTPRTGAANNEQSSDDEPSAQQFMQREDDSNGDEDEEQNDSDNTFPIKTSQTPIKTDQSPLLPPPVRPASQQLCSQQPTEVISIPSSPERPPPGSTIETSILLDTPVKPKPRSRLRLSPPTQPQFVRHEPTQLDTEVSPLPTSRDDDKNVENDPSVELTIMDRNAYLVTLIADLNAKKKAAMAEQLALHEESELWLLVEETMRALYNATGLRIPGMDPETLQTFRSISKIFAKYALLSSNPERSSRPSTLYAEASHKRDLFTHFYHACHDILDRDPESQPLSQVRVIESSDVGDSDEEDQDADEEEILSPRKKNKKRREYKENIEARQQRDLDVRLREEQNQRREKLRRKLAFGNVDADRERIIINETKRDEEGFIYVHDHIARRIKPHQVEGVRFMWSQVVLKEGAQQGCLLAHTMGLGKTMQVITLLVAIIEAATSSDSSVTSQIPDHLKRHRILILAPPGLLNNWMDELLMWFPEDLANRIGGFRTVDSSVPGLTRISMIQAWYEDHGILLLGYQMFRTLVGHERGKKFDEKFDEFREELTKYLLDGPDIIIADEAHQMRNPKSGLGEAVARFRSASRIALTGSPLSNNVLEYHAMINWVAHNYLGPLDEFQAKYARDIKEGLYVESTPTERKRAKKRLAILTEDIGPKVHRADLQVIIDQVPEKKEYVLMTPLTEIQERAYNFFVAARNTEPNDDILTKEGNIKQTALWSWINALSLLDCHPAMYLKALEDKEKKLDLEKAEQKKKSKQDREDSTSEGAETTSLALEPKLQEFREIFSQFGSNWEELAKADLVDLSFRTKITLDIVKACRAAQDKVLIFSHRVATLDYLQHILTVLKFSTARLDGRIVTKNRQQMTKDFNTGHTEVFLISTTAGAIGLNLAGANRVVIFDFGYNPTWEEQAVGRAFRIGQTKPVFVYHLCAAGTYEERLYNQIVFKKQLFATVVDKQDVKANAKKVQGDVLKRAERVNQEDLSPYEDHDPQVLGKLLALQKAGQDQGIRRIIETDTLRRKDDDVLDDMDRAEIARETKDNAARRRDPVGWQRKKDKIAQEAREKAQAEVLYYQQMHGLPGRPALMPSAPMRRQSVTGSSAMPFSATQPALQTFTPLPILPPTSQPPGPKLYGSPLPQRKQHDGNASIQPSGPFTAAANMPEKPPMVIGGELRLIQGSPATAIHAAHNQQAFANNASAASVTAPPSSNGTKSASILPGDTVASKSPAKSPVKAALSTVNGLMLANSTTAKVDCKEDHRIKSLANILGELSDEKAARHSRRISISADNTPLGGVPSASVPRELNTGTSQSKSLPATAANSPAMTQRKPSNGRSTPPSIAIHENGMELRLYSRNELRAMKQAQRPLALAAMEAFRDRQEALGKGVAVSPDYHDAWESVEEDNSPGGGNNGKKHNSRRQGPFVMSSSPEPQSHHSPPSPNVPLPVTTQPSRFDTRQSVVQPRKPNRFPDSRAPSLSAPAPYKSRIFAPDKQLFVKKNYGDTSSHDSSRHPRSKHDSYRSRRRGHNSPPRDPAAEATLSLAPTEIAPSATNTSSITAVQFSPGRLRGLSSDGRPPPCPSSSHRNDSQHAAESGSRFGGPLKPPDSQTVRSQPADPNPPAQAYKKPTHPVLQSRVQARTHSYDKPVENRERIRLMRQQEQELEVRQDPAAMATLGIMQPPASAPQDRRATRSSSKAPLRPQSSAGSVFAKTTPAVYAQNGAPSSLPTKPAARQSTSSAKRPTCRVLFPPTSSSSRPSSSNSLRDDNFEGGATNDIPSPKSQSRSQMIDMENIEPGSTGHQKLTKGQRKRLNKQKRLEMERAVREREEMVGEERVRQETDKRTRTGTLPRTGTPQEPVVIDES